MRSLGFMSIPCGPDGPDAWAIAEEWERRWQSTRRGEAPSPAMVAAENLSPEGGRTDRLSPTLPRGGIPPLPRTDEWSRKAPRTREDWWRGWKRIKPVFGDTDPRTVNLENLSAWRKVIEETVSLREAHRALKIWRALWKVAAALATACATMTRRLAFATPSAHGRSETWTEGEAVRLFKRAWRDGYHGLAAIIAVAWSTQLAPGRRAGAARVAACQGRGRCGMVHRPWKDRRAGRRHAQRSCARRAASLSPNARHRAPRRGIHFSQSKRSALFQGHARR